MSARMECTCDGRGGECLVHYDEGEHPNALLLARAKLADIARLTRERDEAREENADRADAEKHLMNDVVELTAEAERLRAALRALMEWLDGPSGDDPHGDKVFAQARAALEGGVR